MTKNLSYMSHHYTFHWHRDQVALSGKESSLSRWFQPIGDDDIVLPVS